MKAVLNWVKANPIIVICMFLMLAALGVLATVHVQGDSFRKELKDRQNEIQKIESFKNTGIIIPAPNPNDPPQRLNITVNRAAISELQAMYRKLEGEYKTIFEKAVDHNRMGHLPMLDQLFPHPNNSPTAAFRARPEYRRSFAPKMFEPYSKSADYPQLNAKPAPSADNIKDVETAVEQEYLTTMFIPAKARNQLTPDEEKVLKQRQTAARIKFLRDYAAQIHLYAQTNMTAAGFPFAVDAWSAPTMTERPTEGQLWMGQMGLWVQQDIARVIQATNRVDDATANVMVAPIKRLLSVRIARPYVGIASADGKIVADRAKAASEANINSLLPDNFGISASGRQSNPIYDVWHVEVTMIIDAQRLPEIFANLNRTNFMTVLDLEMQDIDEFAALREGYVYGIGDIVQTRMMIETLWLREWTAELMPDMVRQDLNIPERVKPAAPARP